MSSSLILLAPVVLTVAGGISLYTYAKRLTKAYAAPAPAPATAAEEEAPIPFEFVGGGDAVLVTVQKMRGRRIAAREILPRKLIVSNVFGPPRKKMERQGS